MVHGLQPGQFWVAVPDGLSNPSMGLIGEPLHQVALVTVENPVVATAAVLTVIPTMMLFSLASRWIVSGPTAGATKG